MGDDETRVLAEITNGFLTRTVELTEELEVGRSLGWPVPGSDGEEEWHTIERIEPLRGRRDGVACRVHLVR